MLYQNSPAYSSLYPTKIAKSLIFTLRVCELCEEIPPAWKAVQSAAPVNRDEVSGTEAHSTTEYPVSRREACRYESRSISCAKSRLGCLAESFSICASRFFLKMACLSLSELKGRWLADAEILAISFIKPLVSSEK